MAIPQNKVLGGNFVNQSIEKYARRTLGKQADYQSFAGVDIQAYMYMPLYTRSSAQEGVKGGPSKLFANLQTMSISSTRSVSPVRILGRSSPVNYTRGARTIAGTLVFAAINEDVFGDVYDIDIAENAMSASTSLLSDQLPPFSIVLTAANEKGAMATQIVHGITLVNYGTTYSIDDLYTEVTYTYVATDVIPLIARNGRITSRQYGQGYERDAKYVVDNLPMLLDYTKTLSTKVQDSMKKAYGTAENWWRKLGKDRGPGGMNSFFKRSLGGI
jgi:hypothetical protein